jgi:hypothetical protein
MCRLQPSKLQFLASFAQIRIYRCSQTTGTWYEVLCGLLHRTTLIFRRLWLSTDLLEEGYTSTQYALVRFSLFLHVGLIPRNINILGSECPGGLVERIVNSQAATRTMKNVDPAPSAALGRALLVVVVLLLLLLLECHNMKWFLLASSFISPDLLVPCTLLQYWICWWCNARILAAVVLRYI